jgi:hypothetical protein
VATKDQDLRRRAQIRSNGPVESFSVHEIGERDHWLCGICRDNSHLVDPALRRPAPLAPSIDHITPVSSGGSHTCGNVQISHWFCNLEKNAYQGSQGAGYQGFMRAMLVRRLYGTPIPEALWRAKFSFWSMRHEYNLALQIELGDVAAEPGSEPARSRLLRIASARGRGEEAIQQDLARMRAVGARRPSPRASGPSSG